MRGILESFGHQDEIIAFSDCNKVIDYLTLSEVCPILNMSDISMQLVNGYELHDQIVEDAYISFIL
ncbi:hypothetical protein ACX0HA_13210 [Flavobacterium hauense]